MDPGLVACIKAARRMYSVAEYQLAAGTQDGLYRGDPPLVRGLGFPADAIGVGRSVPGGATDAGALAAARLGLAELGASSPIRSTCPGIRRPACRAALPPTACRSGLQIVGRRFDDLGVLQASAAFEQLQPWADKRPATRPERSDAGSASTHSCSAFRRCSPSSIRSAAPSSSVRYRRPPGRGARPAGQAGGDVLAGGDDGGAMGRLLRAGVLRHHPGRIARRRRPGGGAERLASAEPPRAPRGAQAGAGAPSPQARTTLRCFR